MKLNDRTVTGASPKLPSGKAEFIFFDSDIPGFGLRVRKSGSRSWCYQYWHGGRARRVTLGQWPKVSASKAREMIEPLAAKVALGQDPAAEKMEARVRRESFGEIAELFLGRQAKRLRPRSMVEITRHLRTNAKPLHGVPINGLTRRDVAELVSAFAAEKGAVQANRTRASISAMLTWAIKEGLAEANVAAFTNKQAERPRSRVLSGDELASIWKALPPGDFADIVRLLILTGQRKSEIADLSRNEIDVQRGRITLPPERVKNGRPHVVPMSDAVKAIIAARFMVQDRRFDILSWSRCKAMLDASLPKMEPWTLHDLRRSCATGMAEIGIQPHIVEAILNHASGHKAGIAGIYNHAAYEPEKKAALDKWAAHITGLVREVKLVA